MPGSSRMLLCLAWLSLAGCVESPVPLESSSPVTDPALIGIWKSDFDGDPIVATIRQETDGTLVAELQAYSAPGPKAETTRVEIVLAQLGEQRYASIRNPAMAPTYTLARYVFDGKDRFCLHPAPSDSLLSDLKSKQLPGELKADRHLSTVELNASTEQLRAYFASHGEEAFHASPLMAFERATSAALPPPRTQEDRDRYAPGVHAAPACGP